MQLLIKVINGFLEGEARKTLKPYNRTVENFQVLLAYLVCGFFLPTLCRILFL